MLTDKTYSEIYQDLFIAYLETRKTKYHSKAHISFMTNLEDNLHYLSSSLLHRTYVPDPALRFTCDVPVKREIFTSSFAHRVVCRLVYDYLVPVFDPTFIYDSYSCRVGKGTLVGIERLEHNLRSCTANFQKPCYILKCDLSGYFMSIDKRILSIELFNGLARRIDAKDISGRTFRETLDMELLEYLLDVIVWRNPLDGCKVVGTWEDFADLPNNKSLVYSPPGVGLAIGDITSQFFSNLYLNVLDQFVKRELKCRWYGRYVDDFYICHPDREYLVYLRALVKNYLEDRLHLTLNMNKTYITSADRGVNFLGAYVTPFRRYACNRTVRAFHQKICILESLCEKNPSIDTFYYVRSVLNSYLGYFSHFKAFNIVEQTMRKSSLGRYFDYTPDYHKAEFKSRELTEEELLDTLYSRKRNF